MEKTDETNLTSTMPNMEIDEGPVEMKDLPDDVLIKIIEMLSIAQWPSLESVSKQFQRSTFGAWRLLKEIKLDDDFIFDQHLFQNNRLLVLNSILEKLVIRTPNIKSISGFSNFTIDGQSVSMNGEITFNLLARFASLVRVDFGRAKFNVANFTRFLRTSKSRSKLKDLTFELEADLYQQDLLRSAFDDLDFLPLELEKIVFLEEELESNISSYGFVETINVSKLTSLQFSANPTNVEDFIVLMTRADQLEKLDITFTDSLPQQDDVNNEAGLEFNLVRAIGTISSGNLFSLKFQTNYCYFGDSGDGYFQFCSELAGLIEELGKRYRLLEFSLTGHSFYGWFGGISTISSNLIHLTSLELAFQFLPVDLNELTHLVTKLTDLEELTLKFSNSMNGDVISAIAMNLKNLKKLYLDEPYKKNPEIFLCLGRLEKLEELRITKGCISFKKMNGWSEFGRHLKSLEVPECSIVGDKALIDFLKKSPRLRRLDLASAQITDTTLKAIASLCPFMEDLNLAGCTKITLSGIQAVADGCTRLKRLVLSKKEESMALIKKVKFGKYRKIKFD